MPPFTRQSITRVVFCTRLKDFENATYRVIQGSDEAAQALGFGTNNVDTLDMGYKSATATDYTFGNLDDGQDSTKFPAPLGLY